MSQATQLLFVSLLCLTILGCSQSNRPIRLLELPDTPTGDEVRRLSGDISEVAPPAIFLDLAALASPLQPQVEIDYPKSEQVLDETELAVKIKLRGLSIYKEEKTQLGPHLKIVLDNQPAQRLYSLSDPVVFSDLSPGSHTLRVFAALPWGESFKNADAYAQATFHVFAKTAENTPDPNLPLLTYSEPQGTFGAQPIPLDFYLNNAPLHLVAQESEDDNIQDWRIRCTVNGQTFIFDRWQTVYLKGFKPGQNWVQLSLVDEQDTLISGPFNSTVRLVNYDPELKDGLSQLVRGELPIEQVGQIVVPDYQPPAEPLPAEPLPTDSPDEADTNNEFDGAVPFEREISPNGNDRRLESDRDGEENVRKPTADTDSRVFREAKPDKFDRFEDSFEEFEDSEDFEELDNTLPNQPLPEALESAPAQIPIENLDDGKLIAPSAQDQTVVERSRTSPKTQSAEDNPPNKPSFLDQLQSKWRAFQKKQIESQSETIQPSKVPVELLTPGKLSPEEAEEVIQDALKEQQLDSQKVENPQVEDPQIENPQTEPEKISEPAEVEDLAESVEVSEPDLSNDALP